MKCPDNEFMEHCTGDMPDMDISYHYYLNLKNKKRNNNMLKTINNIFYKGKLVVKGLFAFRNVAKEYKDAGNQNVPIYLHRRFIHAVLLAFVVVFGWFFTDITIGEDTINTLTDNIINIGVSVSAVWGIIGMIVGQVKRSRSPKVEVPKVEVLKEE